MERRGRRRRRRIGETGDDPPEVPAAEKEVGLARSFSSSRQCADGDVRRHVSPLHECARNVDGLSSFQWLAAPQASILTAAADRVRRSVIQASPETARR